MVTRMPGINKLAGPCVPDIYLDNCLSAPRIPCGLLSSWIRKIGASRRSVVNNTTGRKKVCPLVRAGRSQHTHSSNYKGPTLFLFLRFCRVCMLGGYMLMGDLYCGPGNPAPRRMTFM